MIGFQAFSGTKYLFKFQAFDSQMKISVKNEKACKVSFSKRIYLKIIFSELSRVLLANTGRNEICIDTTTLQLF